MKLEKILRNFVITSSLIASLASPIHAQDTQQKLTSKEKIELYKRLYPSEFKKNQQENKPDYSWDTRKKVLAGIYCALAALDFYQTSSIPPNRKRPNYIIDKYKETNPLIRSWAGDHPTDLEMFLYYTITTPSYLIASDLIQKHLTSKILPDRYNKYTVEFLMSLGIADYLKKEINNERITGGIIFRF